MHNPCPDLLAETCCSSLGQRTLTCTEYAYLDYSSDTCKCLVGSYLKITGNTRACVKCDNYPAHCTGPIVIKRSENQKLRLLGPLDSKNIHGVCVVETDSLSGFATVNGNDVNYYTL